MTKEEALNLIAQYCAFLDGESYEYHETMTGLRGRFPEGGSEDKAMRWLGFMQGALWALGTFTLDELKVHSKERKVVLSE